MKKILLLVLALACMLSMISCGDDALDAFATAGAAQAPATIVVQTKMTTVQGDLLSAATTTFAEDGSFTLNYWMEKFNAISATEEGEVKSKIETTVTCDKDGKYSDGGTLAATSTATTGHKLVFNPKLMTYTVSADGNVLSATVSADNTEAVFGVAYGADVVLVVTKNADRIISFTLNYTVEAGTVEVKCNYTYPAATPEA